MTKKAGAATQATTETDALGLKLDKRDIFDIPPAIILYGVSGGVRRARRMAIHELVLSVGFVIGAFGGGWVTDHISLRAAYPICAGLLIAGMAAQAIVFIVRNARERP